MEAIDQAAAYLARSMRTKAQVEKYLKDKGYQREEICEAVKNLEEYKIIDDREYCRIYFEHGFEKGRGNLRIKRELEQKGVSRDIINEVYETLDDIPDEFEMAKAMAKEIIGNSDTGSMEYSEKQKLKAKTARRLASKGFSSDIVYSVVNRLL